MKFIKNCNHGGHTTMEIESFLTNNQFHYSTELNIKYNECECVNEVLKNDSKMKYDNIIKWAIKYNHSCVIKLLLTFNKIE